MSGIVRDGLLFTSSHDQNGDLIYSYVKSGNDQVELCVYRFNQMVWDKALISWCA